jgi:hypothetical protein
VKSLSVGFAVAIAALYLVAALRYCARVLRWLPSHERWSRAAQGRCPDCGYDLTGSVSGTCPECGATIFRKPAEGNAMTAPSLITERQPWWVWGLVAAMIVLAVILQRLLWP